MPSNVFILMGVAATGKTTLGNSLAETTDGEFFDGDDFHPESNRKKMSEEKPLNDSDRREWLETLADLIAGQAANPKPTFIACSALKESYRNILRSKYSHLKFLFLTADPDLLRQRITERYESGEHFMPPSLLDSQLNTLEPPEEALKLDVSKPVSELVTIFLKWHSQ
jgi:gluconokinase